MSNIDNNFDRRSFLKATGGVGAAAAVGGLAVATPSREPGPKTNEVLVGVSAGAGDLREVAARHAPAEAEVVHTNESLRYAAVEFPEEAADAAKENYMDAVMDEAGVKYAEENATYHTQYTPSDPQFSDQYVPQMVNADQAWDTTLGSWDATIAVVDTGIQYKHPDLDGNFGADKGKDFVDSDDDPKPDNLADEYHGTHVAGIAAGETDNGLGIAGISESKLLSGRALDESGSGSAADLADAIQWAADQGAEVINLSFGGGGYTSTMKSAVDYAYNNGSLLVAAAGNDGGDVIYPAAYSEVMAVSALDSDGTIASYSSTGSAVEICAPGSNVLSTMPDDTYGSLSGTSMAAPVVSGVAGLALSEFDLTNVELRTHLKNTAVNIGLSASKMGSGRVDAANAVQTAPGPCGDSSNTTTLDDQLSGSADSDCWLREWEYAKPCRVTVDLSGPSGADFDLYVNEGSGTCPTTSDYDYRGFSADSQESIVIDNPDDSAPLFVRVDSYNGSGDYTLTITEEGT